MVTRFFNTAGVCEPRDHYMLPPQRRLPSLGSLIARKSYFVVQDAPEIADPVIRELKGRPPGGIEGGG